MKKLPCALPLLTALLSVSCGGGGGGGASPEPGRVSIAADVQVLPWTTGQLDFVVTPALASNESISCRIDDSVNVPCTTTGTKGKLNFSALAEGNHSLTVNITAPSGARSEKLSWQIARPDVVVLGGTPGGIIAAVSAARLGQRVLIIEPSPWLGGLMTGGLSKTDVGRSGPGYIGGPAAEVFRRTHDTYVKKGYCNIPQDCPDDYVFEPRVAGEAFQAMISEARTIQVQRSLNISGVSKSGTRITAVNTARGQVTGKVFVDASYEADLTAMAGVTTTMQREARRTDVPVELQEDDAGVGEFIQPFGTVIDPYVIPGKPSSGLIPFVQPYRPLPVVGSADKLVMAYNYRVCVTDDPQNRVPFPKPAGYNPAMYEGAARVVAAIAAADRPQEKLYFNPAPTVRSLTPGYFKYDLNGGAVFSTDMTAPDLNQAYPEANAAEREKITQRYRDYTQGLMYFWQTEPRFSALHARVSSFGLCKDEFTDNGNFPYRLYTRETRRMVGEYVVNANDFLSNGRRPTVPDSIGMGSYNMDSHGRQIMVIRRSIKGGPVQDMVGAEGFRGILQPGDKPYPVAYRSLTPQRSQITNLLNPVTPSSTSLAYSSLRMEPTFMILGHAAGTAAALAIRDGVAVQDLNINTLQTQLRLTGQVLN